MRYFAKINIKELKAKVEEEFAGCAYLMREKFEKDLKVNFDCENFEMAGNSKILGYHTLSNGLTFLGCCASGDWQTSVTFVVYFDGKKLRAYVPTAGNPWNTTTKQAYGNDELADEKNAHKRWPDKYKGISIDDIDFTEEYNEELMLKEITEHILFNGPTMPVRDEINNLKYYCLGADEALELFQATCNLCYLMEGFGENAKAKTLCRWAKQQAKASEKWAKEAGVTKFFKGNWGS